MRGLQKSKRISWASDVNLCQVRLFLSEESPSLVGLGAQDHLQAKASWPSLSSGMGNDDNLPPGFEGAHPTNLLKNKLSQIPLIKWRCPPKFVLDITWQVVAGEESKEVEVQNQLEMRVLEAIYPRLSSIPSNPSVSIGIEDSHHNDQHTLLIPITPIEDEDTTADASFDIVPTNTVPMSFQAEAVVPVTPASQYMPPASGIAATSSVHGVEPGVVAAAHAALSAVMTSSDQGNLIDGNLLTKILSNPNLIEKLVTGHGAATNPPPIQINRTEVVAPLLAAMPNGPFYPPPPSRVAPGSIMRPPLPEIVSGPPSTMGVKDINYYKSLIQQHGGERQETFPQFSSRPNQESVIIPKSKPKIMKPCMYFNSSRGCRHGANCSYQHDTSAQQRVSSMPEVQSAKRMKMDKEITGT